MRALILNANIKKEQRSKTHMNMLMKIRMIKAKWIRLQEPNAYELKTCSRCKVEKYKWQFQKNRARPDGLRCDCGECNNKLKKDTWALRNATEKPKGLLKTRADAEQYKTKDYDMYACSLCKYQTADISNFTKHLNTKRCSQRHKSNNDNP